MVLVREISKVGKRGAVVIPARLRRLYGIEEGMLVTMEETETGILIRPAVAIPLEEVRQLGMELAPILPRKLVHSDKPPTSVSDGL